MSTAGDFWEQLSAELRSGATAAMAAEETPLEWVELDLDTQLQYASALLVLTNRRLLEIRHGGVVAGSWPLEQAAGLQPRDYFGTGRLELLGPTGLLAEWRYTIGRSPAAHRLAAQFERLRCGGSCLEEEPAEPPTTTCPTCGAVLAVDQAVCPECGSGQQKPSARHLLRLVWFARSRKWIVLLGLALMIASSGASLAPTYLTIPLIDNVLKPAEQFENVVFRDAAWYLLGFGLVSVLAWLLAWARTFVLARVGERIAVDLRNRIYGHMQGLSLEFFSGKRTGDLIARVSTDTDRICYYLTVNLLDFANDVLTLLFMVVIMLSLDPMLTLATLLPLPLIAYLVHRVRNRLRRGFALGARAWAELTSVLADTMPGIRVVKAFAQEKREIERFRAANDRVLRANDRVNNVWTFFEPGVALLTACGLLTVWAFGAWQIVEQHSIKVGVLVGFVQYISRFYGRMDAMSRMVAATQRAGASAQRIFAILDRVPSVAEPLHPVPIENPRGKVEFREVGFHYGNRPILRGISFTVQPGEMVGLVGPSGAGKTTLVNLACRFYDVTEGAILVDDVDICSYGIADYRRHIGLVLQEPFLFYGTIAENIAYGRPDAGREEIIAAARAARAHDFILRLPDGYDSLVGERGQLLSGGERQRISIARALLIDPRILILDEATSSVDTETEREIQLAVENLVRGRTTIAIAHRISTLRRADRLVVMEQGRIVEVGPHDELLRRDGAYARLHRAQQEMGREEKG